MKKILTIAAIAALAGTAVAQISESTGDLTGAFGGNIPSLAGGGITGTPQVTYTFMNSFTIGDIDWSGVASPINAATWESELDVDFYLNGTILGSGGLGVVTGAYSAGNALSGTFIDTGIVVNAGDVFGFEFNEGFDDGGDSLADAEWESIEFTFNEFVAPMAPAAVDLGTFAGPQDVVAPIGAGEVLWYTFDVVGGVAPTQINTFAEGTIGDTELGLYDDAGNLLATNDDAFGGGLQSRIGGTSTLADGTYYVAVGAFNTGFAAVGWGATSSSATDGVVTLRLVPAPGAAALLGLAGVAGMRRRRA